jgi:hypothetical protein
VTGIFKQFFAENSFFPRFSKGFTRCDLGLIDLPPMALGNNDLVS